ncbi:MAG: hypothetical protein ACJAZO_000645 [Myxococcota bacterium]
MAVAFEGECVLTLLRVEARDDRFRNRVRRVGENNARDDPVL